MTHLCSPPPRCSACSPAGGALSVRRVLAACVLSLVCLLGAVSEDLGSGFQRLRSTEEAYATLTSCRGHAALQLVQRLQRERRSVSRGNGTPETGSPGSGSPESGPLCAGLAPHSDGRGVPCEPSGSCQELRRGVQGLLNASVDPGGGADVSSALSRAIGTLLDSWGTVGDALARVQQNSQWRDVLSARVLLGFIELNLQLRDRPLVAAQRDFRSRWTRVLGQVGAARLLAERLDGCWLDNVDLRLNSTWRAGPSDVLDPGLWPVSGPGPGLLSGSLSGIRALTATQKCLLDRAVPALRRAARSATSGLSLRVCLLALALLIYPAALLSFQQMTEWIQDYARSLRAQAEALRGQRQRAEDLLHQMLPKSVARQLRQNQHVKAESYEQVGAP